MVVVVMTSDLAQHIWSHGEGEERINKCPTLGPLDGHPGRKSAQAIQMRSASPMDEYNITSVLCKNLGTQ
jgi:hypothetical protein